jgi:hypothetical protein
MSQTETDMGSIDMVQCQLCMDWMHVDNFRTHRMVNHPHVESRWLRFLRWVVK